MTAETVGTSGAVCLRCSSTRLVPAQLQHTLAFCVDEDTHHGVRHLGLRASLCRDCGHVELRVPDPARVLKRDDAVGAIQEEDF